MKGSIPSLFALLLALTPAVIQGREILFSGLRWNVKDSGADKWGPGPNYFSPSSQNVWLDEAGYLHLKISRRQNKWYCAEVISKDSLGFGLYEWRVRQVSPRGELDANVVLGLFTWSDRPEYTHREIDVEVARWGQPHLNTNSQFVVQPYKTAGHLKRFSTPSVANVTHSFDWMEDRVEFMSEWTSSSGLSHNATWSFVNGSSSTAIVPQPFDENARMNLWLFNVTAGPLSGDNVEVVLERFSFTPRGGPKPSDGPTSDGPTSAGSTSDASTSDGSTVLLGTWCVMTMAAGAVYGVFP